MAKMYVIKGRSTYDGVVHKNFEVIAPLERELGSDLKIQAVKKLHPDWEEISIDSWKEL